MPAAVPYATFVYRFEINEAFDPLALIKGGTMCAGHAAKRNGISHRLVPDTQVVSVGDEEW